MTGSRGLRSTNLQYALFALNVFALFMLSGMSDLAGATRVEIAVVVVINLGCLLGRTALMNRPARWGATVSLVGYLSAVAAWLVLALGCGIEYFNARCDAIVDPLIMISLGLGFAALSIGRTIGLVVRSR
ncbi:MAG TPA: hypothetical protein VGX46_19035 [Vicinamibacterales bacterium]|nr:hypothetical protein [Vicinamibacterales bacterium]